MPMPRIITLFLALLALVASPGCGGSGCCDGNGGPGPNGQVAAFSLEDVNATSATYQQAVSPRDHISRISAWYFGQAG